MSINSRWSRLAPVVAVAVAFVVAGCGSGGTSKNDYVESLNKAQTTLSTQLTDIGNGISAGDTKAAAAQLDKGGKAIDAAADDFNSIQPPDNAAGAHKKIVDGLHKLAGTFREAADAARSKDLDKLSKTLSDITTSAGAKELQDAENELVANGYKVQGQ
jgi:hypothetical protein